MRYLIGLLILGVAICSPIAAWAAAPGWDDDASMQPFQGDPLWQPTVEEVQQWIDEGIEAAAAGTPLWELQAITDATWADANGIPCSDGYLLVYGFFMSPRLIAAVLGHRAALDEVQWERITDDREAVSRELAKGMEVARRPIFECGIAGEQSPVVGSLHPMVWYQGYWRRGTDSGGSEAVELIEPARRDAGSAEIALHHLLSQGMYEEALFDLAGVWEFRVEWGRRTQLSAAWQEMVDAVPAPPDDIVRLAIGTPDEYAFLDF